MSVPNTTSAIYQPMFNETQNETTSIDQSEDAYSNVKDIMYMIEYVTMPVLLVFGVLGNACTIITMSSKKFDRFTSRPILIALALSDTILLLTQILNKLWVIRLFGSDLRAISNVTCKLFFIIFKASKMTSSWFVVLICFDRYVAVTMPMKYKQILQKRNICVAIAVNYFVMLVYNSIWSFSSLVVNGFCRNDMPSREYNIFLVGGASLYSIIPTMILLVLTPRIVIKLVMQRRFQKDAATGNEPPTVTRRNDRMYKASVTLIAVMIAYVILVIPITTVHLYAFYNKYATFQAVSGYYFIYREAAMLLEQINYSINFVFYVICLKPFREHLFQMIGISKCVSRDTQKPTGSTKRATEVSAVSNSNGSF